MMNRRGKLAIANAFGLVVTLVVFVAVLVVVTFSVAPSADASGRPWWHLTVGAAPAVLQPGRATDEVQEVVVSATGGTYGLVSTYPVFAAGEFSWDATDAELQTGLEEMFGTGAVEVLPGKTSGPEIHSYQIVFKGALSDTWIETLSASGALVGGSAQVTVKEITQGASDGRVILSAANMSGEDLIGEKPVTLADELPPGLKAVGIEGFVQERGAVENPVECSLATLSCTSSERVPPYEEMQVFVSVDVEKDAHSGEPDKLTVSGGNALPAKVERGIAIGNGPTSFGVEDYELTPEEANGSIDTQAGSHPFQLTTILNLNRNYEQPFCGQCLGVKRLMSTPELTKDLNFKLPPGLIGNPTPFPQCTMAQFLNSATLKNECADDTAIGVASSAVWAEALRYGIWTAPLFNLTPSVGEPARFGFLVEGAPVILDTSVRTGGDYGITVSVKNITQSVQFLGSRVTFWGVPGDPRHDNVRGWDCLENTEFPSPIYACNATEAHNPPPLLELPTSCTGPLQASVEGDSWKQEGLFTSVGPTVPLPALDGCNALPFTPSISVAPDGHAGSTPTGLTVGVHVPQEVSLDPEGLGEADVKSTSVALPAGVATNPSSADGLLSCSEEQISLSVDVAPACPEASKVGLVEIKSPLLPNALTGSVYLAAQSTNPFGSLIALYLVAQDPVSGTLIKVAGEVKLDPVTGQLVSTFDNTPQLPFEELSLHFFGGDRAPLGTPSLCGAYTTTASIQPWSENAPAEPSSTFDVVSGPNGSACHAPLPFEPSLAAGTTNIQAGGFTPFTMTVSREDGQQNIKGFQLHMPPGLSGLLSGVELCPESQADAGTCGPNSLIGETTVSVGLGSDPYSVKGGRVYITGPYEGAPFGVSVVVRAKAGPFDLGNVIVRGTITVDPITAALTVTIDGSGPYKIPSILDGIPLQIKHINFTTTRPGFTFNPTDCDPMSVTGSMSSTEGATAALSVPFQVTNCAVLGFKPGFKVSTAGKTSRANGASLTVKLTYPKMAFGSQANIKSVKVDLPKQLPSRLTTLQKACPSAQFQANPAGCPAASIVGHATAITPLIPVPLAGPAYFVSYGGLKFPELVVALQGYGVSLDLHGETYISKAGITSSTFHTIPDAPVGSFELTLPQGKYSALAANGNLCTSKLTMPTAFTAQNGATIKQSTPISVTGCAKHKKAQKPKKTSKHKGKGKGKRQG
jgi:hypothetical protein